MRQKRYLYLAISLIEGSPYVPLQSGGLAQFTEMCGAKSEYRPLGTCNFFALSALQSFNPKEREVDARPAGSRFRRETLCKRNDLYLLPRAAEA